MLWEEHGRLMRQMDGELLCIEPWGANSLRVRAAQYGCTLEGRDFALLPPQKQEAEIVIANDEGSIRNGKITARISRGGKITFYHQDGHVLLEEYARNLKDLTAKECSALEIESRAFTPILGGDYQLTVRFEAFENEKIFGMGQYQQDCLELKGCTLELAQRNSQASVPFLQSSRGYGFLWNNPAIGQVTFAKNITEWRALSTKGMDYWITAGDCPAQISAAYADATGHTPAMPEYGLGFWQCKLRYQTQEELMRVAREHKRRGLPMDVIVIDYFHWPLQGDWCFDPQYWPDPEGMIAELKEMGITLMVSIWPTVDKQSQHYQEMNERGLLVRCERGINTSLDLLGATRFYDPTNPEARAYVWEKVKASYYDKGIPLFWLDVAEPQYHVYDFDNYRYHAGSNLQIGNIYPLMYARTFFDGQRNAGQGAIVNLLRCAWAGSQRYGALVWSGDIASSFRSLNNQLAAGLNMGMAGIPWWTTDIGGFHGGNPQDPAFRELFARWFAWGCFCPVMRLHGDREPHNQPPLSDHGGGMCISGAENEVWSYGEEIYEICKKYLALRETLRPYVRDCMARTQKTGEPIMRPMFFDFPEDTTCWTLEKQYMFGPEYLVAPVLSAGARSVKVYLPQGQWTELETGKEYEGGQWLQAEAPLDVIPVYRRERP